MESIIKRGSTSSRQSHRMAESPKRPTARLPATAPSAKKEDDAEIERPAAQLLPVMGDVIFMQGLHPGPQVADAHGGGNAVALYLAEGLHLDAAGQRGEAIGPKMLSCREKS